MNEKALEHVRELIRRSNLSQKDLLAIAERRFSIHDQITTNAKVYGESLTSLTVLAAQRDPYRLDTPKNHEIGQWLKDEMDRAGLADRKVHLRGLHYILIGSTKPDGSQYVNDDRTWTWMSEEAAKAARWLGYVPFDGIIDQRNAEPIFHSYAVKDDPVARVNVDFYLGLPDLDELRPTVKLDDEDFPYDVSQEWQIVMIGEKSSLEPVLDPIARRFSADLWLPTGEASDTLLYRMARRSVSEERPMAVFYFSDCDPSGHSMAISVSRKLQAFRSKDFFPKLDFEVRRVALLPDQVREHGLPSTPMKDTEGRADAWELAMGVKQTEIDALAALNPGLLQQIAVDAIAPFFDSTLEERVDEARDAWLEEAQRIVDEHLDPDAWQSVADAHAAVDTALAELRERVTVISNVAIEDLDLPEFDLPEPEELTPPDDDPLVSSEWVWVEQTRRLVDAKKYGLDEQTWKGLMAEAKKKQRHS